MRVIRLLLLFLIFGTVGCTGGLSEKDSNFGELGPTGITREVLEAPETSDAIRRNYTWEYGLLEFGFEVDFYKKFYEYYKERPRPPTTDYSIYVTDPFDDDMIATVVWELEANAKRANLNEYETAEYVISFIQSLPYTKDDVTTPYDDYPRYPIETLVDYGGDCEDTSVLAASFLKEMGYDVVLIVFPEHIGIGISGDESIGGHYYPFKEKKYFYLETTGSGWDLGVVPEQYLKDDANIYELESTPLLVHQWKGEPSGEHLKLEIKLENVGSKAAGRVKVVAGFDAGDTKAWNVEESIIHYLDIGSYATIILYPEVPEGKRTRVVIQIIDEDGYIVDQSRSEWFDT